MTDEQRDAPKYHVEEAHHSAVGDYAQVNNYFSAQQAAQEPALAQLRQLFEEVNQRLAALEAADRAMVAPAVSQTAQATAAIQQGDDSEAQQSFLAQRLKAVYSMAPDIGAVIITTLANPALGIALTVQKIAQKAQEEMKIKPS